MSIFSQCAKSVGLDPEDILKCYNSEEGTNYQLSAEKDTTGVLNSPLKSVPTIVYNEVNNYVSSMSTFSYYIYLTSLTTIIQTLKSVTLPKTNTVMN